MPDKIGANFTWREKECYNATCDFIHPKRPSELKRETIWWLLIISPKVIWVGSTSITSWRCLISLMRSRSFLGIPKVPSVRWLDWFDYHILTWQTIGLQKFCTFVFLHCWLAGMEPAFSPKLVCPIQVAPVSFEQVLSDKLHITLVIKPVGSKMITHAMHSLMLSNPTESICHLTPAETSGPKSKITSLLCNSGMSGGGWWYSAQWQDFK